MSVDRLSVTVRSELGEALRALAAERGESVSQIVTEAIEQRVRLAALDHALAEADRIHGPVPEQVIAKAMAERLSARARSANRKPKRRRER